MGNPGDNTWAFGQVISLVLLTSPLTQIFESVYQHLCPRSPYGQATPRIRASLVNAPVSNDHFCRNSVHPTFRFPESMNAAVEMLTTLNTLHSSTQDITGLSDLPAGTQNPINGRVHISRLASMTFSAKCSTY